MKTISTTLIALIFACASINAQNLMLSNGAKAIIGPGASFTFAEVMNDDPADLQIRSDASGSGSLIYTNEEYDQPYATVELWVGDTENWHFVSPPTTGASAADFYIEGMQPTGLMWFDENVSFIPPPAPNSQNGWTFILDLEQQINVGQGYGYYQSSERSAETGKVTFTGQLRSADTDYGSTGLGLLQYSGPPVSNYGWNLIGNPYSAAIMQGVGTSAEGSGLEGAVWIWEGGGTNNYVLYRVPPGAGDDPLVVPMGQAFFVHANAASPELTVFADSRTHNHSQQIYKKETEEFDDPYGHIDLLASNNGATDRFSIEVQLEDLTVEEKLQSISKLFGPEESPQLYSPAVDRNLSILTCDMYDSKRVVDLNYIPGAEGDQLFAFDISLPEESEIYLEDKLTGWMQDLIEEPEYAFQGSKEDDADRFRIHFSLKSDEIDPFGMDQNIDIYAWDKAVYIKNPTPSIGSSSRVMIYDTFGKAVYANDLHLGTLTRIPVDVKSAYLIVKLRNGDEVITEKVFVR